MHMGRNPVQMAAHQFHNAQGHLKLSEKYTQATQPALTHQSCRSWVRNRPLTPPPYSEAKGTTQINNRFESRMCGRERRRGWKCRGQLWLWSFCAGRFHVLCAHFAWTALFVLHLDCSLKTLLWTFSLALRSVCKRIVHALQQIPPPPPTSLEVCLGSGILGGCSNPEATVPSNRCIKKKQVVHMTWVTGPAHVELA